MLEGLKDYIKVAKEFSEETKEWYNLDEYKHYIATGICGNEYGYGWRESCDNAEGGLDIKWAFHLSPEEIEKCALDELSKIANEMLEEAYSMLYGKKTLKEDDIEYCMFFIEEAKKILA